VRCGVGCGILTLAILLAVRVAAKVADQPTSKPADTALWQKLTEIDQRAGQIKSLSASFDQQKVTSLLRKPLDSAGRVRIKGSIVRWDTSQPEQSVLLIDQGEAKVYYPTQKTLEIYPLDKKLADLAASPLPRLDVLKERFAIEQIPVAELEKSAAGKAFIALRLTPKDPSLAEHVKQVRVLLDVRQAYIMKAEVTDGDGDRTVLSFKDVQLNADVGDLSLVVPPGTAVTHPLEGLDGQPPQSQGKSK
jgi:outer membrane lipoprotein-sorting protein